MAVVLPHITEVEKAGVVRHFQEETDVLRGDTEVTDHITDRHIMDHHTTDHRVMERRTTDHTEVITEGHTDGEQDVVRQQH